MGTIGSRLNGSTVELVFTPLPSIDIEVNVFMNALRIQDDTQDEISFNNGSIRSGMTLHTLKVLFLQYGLLDYTGAKRN